MSIQMYCVIASDWQILRANVTDHLLNFTGFTGLKPTFTQSGAVVRHFETKTSFSSKLLFS